MYHTYLHPFPLGKALSHEVGPVVLQLWIMTYSHIIINVVCPQFPSCNKALTFCDWQGYTILRSSSLTVAITHVLSITCSKMNEDGLCVTAQPVYIYFNRYSGEGEEVEEDNRGRKPLLMYM